MSFDFNAALEKLKNTEIEEDLKYEKDAVIEYGTRKFKKRSATVGGTLAGLFMIPMCPPWKKYTAFQRMGEETGGGNGVGLDGSDGEVEARD